jgi:hypothetical protein
MEAEPALETLCFLNQIQDDGKYKIWIVSARQFDSRVLLIVPYRIPNTCTASISIGLSFVPSIQCVQKNLPEDCYSYLSVKKLWMCQKMYTNAPKFFFYFFVNNDYFETGQYIKKLYL